MQRSKMVGFAALAATLALSENSVQAGEQHSHSSHYAGQQNREIKSLSANDIKALRSGSGWGLAKAAELNGVPGPVHLLQLKREIGLTQRQSLRITALYTSMRQRAVEVGAKLINLESRLDAFFKSGSGSSETLMQLLEEISTVHGELRYVHLSAHLKTPKILTREQMEVYNHLRGYGN